jgi:outer membrane protein TolC
MQLNDAVTLADRQQQAGSLTRIDARLLRIESAGRAADLIELRTHAEELRLAILCTLGLAPQSAVKLVPSLAFTLPATAGSTTDPLAAAANPELAAIRAQYAIAEAALKLEVRKQYPDLTIGPGYATDQGDDRATLGLSLPLPIWNRNASGVAQATAEREAAHSRFESAFERLTSNLAIATARYDSAVRQRQTIEATVIPLTDEQDADVRRVSALGRLEPLLMLETLKAQHAAKLRLVEAQLLQSLSAARLAELLGPPAPAQAPASSN